MTMHRFVLASLITAVALASAPSAAPAQGSVSEEDARALGIEAYIYGYPLVTMEVTRRVMTNVSAPTGKLAPMGQFASLRAYPTPADKEVTAPNADTLYSLAWLDVSKEPYILGIPDEGGRYFLLPMLSGWTDVFQVPGKRTTGTGAQTYAITGPGWKGTLPEGVTRYESPTGIVWILGRTYCTGTPEDYAAVHAIQDRYALVPLSAYGKAYHPPDGKVDPAIDMKTPVREQVNRMDAATYFTLLASLLKENPPTKADEPLVAKMAKIGLVPGRDFVVGKPGTAIADGLASVPAAGWNAIMAHQAKGGTEINGWNYSLDTGLYGTDYLQRALVTAIGLGANRPQDAVYPYVLKDGNGQRLSGKNRYLIHFPKGQTPPVNGFWSVTMYDSDYFFVPNSINRYAISPRDALKANEDGSVDLYVQHETPGQEKESNWLPAPDGDFILMLRTYWPKESILDRSWTPPPVKRVP